MQSQIGTREIYARHTDCSGKTYVSSHWVWDADLFIAARRSDAEKANEKQEAGKPRLARFDQITQEQFTNEKAPRK